MSMVHVYRHVYGTLSIDLMSIEPHVYGISCL